MPAEIAVVTRPEDLRDIFCLRHEVYALEESLFDPRSRGLICDEFDAYRDTLHVLARVDGRPAAALRAMVHSSVGLPWEGAPDPRRTPDRDSGTLASVGMLVCRREFRGRFGLALGLIRRGLQALRARGADRLVIGANPAFGPTLRRMGLSVAGPAFREEGIRGEVVPMGGRLSGFVPPFAAEFADDDLAGFADPGRRELCRRGELVHPAGVRLAQAWVVTRGEVRLEDAAGHPVGRCGPGQPVGLAPLVTSQDTPVAAVVGNRGAELAPIPRSEVLAAGGQAGPQAVAALRALARGSFDSLAEAAAGRLRRAA